MKKFLALSVLTLVALFLSHPLKADSLKPTVPPTVAIYAGFTCNPPLACSGGAPFSVRVGSFYITDTNVDPSQSISFGSDFNWDWHPFLDRVQSRAFGADIAGFINVETTATYVFTLQSDDGSLLFIGNSLVVKNGGLHEVKKVSGSVSLNKGGYPFEVQFFENGGGESGLNLFLPAGVSYAIVPELSSLPLLLTGIGFISFRRLLSALRG